MSSLPLPVTWIAVSKSALQHNAGELRRHLATASTPPRLIAVVKANAYGHDAVQAVPVLAAAGIDFFAVTTASEAIELRDAGVKEEILVFAPPMADEAEALIERGVCVTVADPNGFGVVANAAGKVGKDASVHVKVDTGMGRLGFLSGAAVAACVEIRDMPYGRLAGVYTHFGNALAQDFAPMQRQFKAFQEILASIRHGGIDPAICHCCNSASMLRDESMWLDAVRAGTILYGQYPSASVPRTLDLRDTWQMNTHIVSLREVPAGTAIGYGGEFVTRRPSRLAVIPVGYADGFTVAPASVTSGWRGLKSMAAGAFGKNAPTVTVRSAGAPVVGRVAMQMCTLDVTGIDGVETGDIVTVPTRRLTASSRIPRVYGE